MTTCPVCDESLPHETYSGRDDMISVECAQCGNYCLDAEFYEAQAKPKKLGGDPLLISACLRFHSEKGQRYDLSKKNSVAILLSATPIPRQPYEQINLFLTFLAKRTRKFGKMYALSKHDKVVGFCDTPEEFRLIIREMCEDGLLRVVRNPPLHMLERLYLTNLGWKKVESLLVSGINSTQAFVGMFFNKSLRTVYMNGILPALEECGYRAVRVDDRHYEAKTCDEIISLIRSSRICVMDFTGQRPNVYYECGFAEALKIPVIRTCKEDQVDNLQFDIRQYPHLLWNTPEELKKKIKDRIEAMYRLC